VTIHNIRTIYSKLFIILLLLAINGTVQAQTTVVSGTITDAESNEAVPYANVVFKGTSIGAISDTNGHYQISARLALSAMQVSAVGYKMQEIKLKPGNQVINIRLMSETYDIDQVDVRPPENPAHPLLRKIIARKDINDPKKFPDYQCKVYTKMEIDLKNVKEPKKDSKLWSQFAFVFAHIDTLKSDGKTYLPVFMTETFSDYYHQRDDADHERVLATKASGMTTSMITEFTGKMYQDFDIYANYLHVSDIGLISPLNNHGLMFYEYYLLDSAQVDGHKVYEVSFKPKQVQSPTFTGKFWVADSTYAITKVAWKLSKKANINFVNTLDIDKEFRYSDGRWLPRKDMIFADINLQKNKEAKMIGIMGRKTTMYDSLQFSPPPRAMQKMKREISIANDALEKDSAFWTDNRPEQLSKSESQIYSMVDSIKNVPLFKTVADYIHMFYYGYKDLGTVELGPYYYMYSYNQVEGQRFRFGARTTLDFDKNWRFNGFGAYGLKDQAFKYGGGAEYFFKKDPEFSLSAQYEHDYQLIGKSSNAFMEDNIMTSLLSKNPTTRLNMMNQFNFTVTKEWLGGWKNQLQYSYNKMYTGPYVPFIAPNGNTIDHIEYGELTLKTRFAPGQHYMQDDFEKIYLDTKNPIINLNLTMGRKELGGDYNYYKVYFDMYDKLPVSPFGYTTYLLRAGKTWGTVPFPLLKIHEGNETYAYDIYAYNLMNYQEFASDQWASLSLEQHFNGFFLNKIPLMRKLKWRTVAGLKVLEGRLNSDTQNEMQLLPGMTGLGKKPYMETSVGIENILKLLRVDAVWRLNYHNPDVNNLGIFFSLQFSL